jgi:hypothetical protein
VYKSLWITKLDLDLSGHQPTYNILHPLDRFLSNFYGIFSLNSVNQIQTDVVFECLHNVYSHAAISTDLVSVVVDVCWSRGVGRPKS